jgi:hypothetical protein
MWFPNATHMYSRQKLTHISTEWGNPIGELVYF